jgi:DNA-binding beta-propeller fold protein YncE
LSTRVVEGGYFASFSAGRIGRGAKLPPQLGQRPASFPSTQSRQNVHSKVQIIASCASGGRSLSQHSQLGRSANMLSPFDPILLGYPVVLPFADREPCKYSEEVLRILLQLIDVMAILWVATQEEAAMAEQALFESRRLTEPGEYPDGIEGPAVDAAGNLYVVNFREKGTIGRVRPGASTSELFARLPTGSIGNGTRFDREGRMYVADFKKHNVFVFESGQSEPRVYFHSDQFHQPNDLAIAADGTLYASDPKRGQPWSSLAHRARPGR